MRPWAALAAMPTAQWQAELISHARPDSMDSKAPRLISVGAPSAVSTEGLRVSSGRLEATNS